MFRFSIGYQATDPYDFVDLIDAHRDRISEVYFPWFGIPDGRGLSVRDDTAQAEMEEALRYVHDTGIALNLLFNGSCYGVNAVSKAFKASVLGAVEYAKARFGLEAITTTSPFVAEVVSSAFDDLDIRASVNMEIGTVRGLRYVEEFFDSFYVARTVNRSPSKIVSLKAWCVERGKKLYLLANSGCLRDCSAHVFHDNLVAHEKDPGAGEKEWPTFPGICWDFLKRPERRNSFLLDTTWIRPEDLVVYQGLIDGIKLATRSHRNPLAVLDAYAAGSYKGNPLSLCEPDFSALCAIDNARFPADWLSPFDDDSEEASFDRLGRVFSDPDRGQTISFPPLDTRISSV